MPDPPPGIARPNDPYEATWWPGVIVDWRGTDKKHAEWMALVSYQRPNGLQYLHWSPGILLKERLDDELRSDAGPRDTAAHSSPIP